MKNYLKNILFGFISWLVPFVASLFFYTSSGKLTIDAFLFKNIMLIVGSISAALLLIFYFKKINGAYFKEGIIVGLTWFAINIILDIIILIPMSGMSLADYLLQIGLGYLVIPAMSITAGTVLANKK
jgi:signal transduction histidine kinase